MSALNGRMRHHRRVVYVSAWSFILLAAFYSSLSLSQSFASAIMNTGYENFIAALAAVTQAEKLIWISAAFIPLLFIPASMGYYSALRPTSPYIAGFMILAFTFSALAYCASLARWSLIHLNAPELWEKASESDKQAIGKAIVFLDSYMGNIIGTLVAEGMLSAGFYLMAYAMHKAERFPRWLISFIILVAVWLSFSLLRIPYPVLSGVHMWGEMLLILPLLFIALGLGMFLFRQPREKKIARYKKKKKTSKKNHRAKS